MIIDLAKNKQEFLSIVDKYIKRDGVDKLIRWLEDTDFFVAPATTQYKLSIDGGLCQHALNTFNAMVRLADMHYGKEPSDDNYYNGDTDEAEGSFNLENIAIVALFHEINKANCYVKDYRNVKVDGTWKQVEYWKWDEQFIYGRGTKSVYILQQFMRLYIDEAQAIRYHTAGREDVLSGIFDVSFMKVYDNSDLASLLFLATSMAYWLIDGR